MEGLVTQAAAVNRFAPTPVFWSGKRVFLTGHTGFKGSWLTFWLAKLGAIVRGYALEPDTDPSIFHILNLDQDCDSLIADVRDNRLLARAIANFRPDIAIHMAAQPLVRVSYRDPLATFDINVRGTANFLEACRGIDTLRTAIVVTTDKCYRNREEFHPYREDEPLGGYDPYSASKACAEIVTEAYRKSFFGGNSSARIASARAGNVFGGGDWCEDRLIPDAMRAFSKGQSVSVRNPGAVRPWQHVAVLSQGYLMLARALWEEGEAFATAFNFGPSGDRIVAVRALIEQMASAWGEGARWESHPDRNAPHEAQLLMLDPSQARTKLQWRPADDLHASIAATVAWYKAFYAGAGADAMRELTSQQITALAQAPQPIPGQFEARI